jgi:hypothetical protein
MTFPGQNDAATGTDLLRGAHTEFALRSESPSQSAAFVGQDLFVDRLGKKSGTLKAN